MKAKHKREWLQMKQNWWSKLPASVQKATTKPGSVKHDDYLIIVLVCLILLNPYIDIQQDKIIIWYNWFTERKYYILWKPQNS